VFVLGALAAPQLAGAAGYWTPPVNATWQWQLSVPVDQTVDASVYDIDLFENEASVVASLHAQGRHVICYMDAGTWEGWRPDASKFPASVLGKADPGWTEEKWLDIRQLSIIEPLMEARFKLCKEKGFDGIEADNVDGWQNNTGFPITAAEQLTYDEWLANTAHSLGLSIALKSDTQQIPELEPYYDYSVDEECVEYSECSLLEPFVKAGKPVFEVEYAKTPSQFCAETNALGLMAMQKGKELEAWNAPCWAQGNWVGSKGAAGYDLAGFNGSSDLTNMPGVTVTLAKGSRLVWASPSTDPRALESPSGTSRSAAAYSDPSEVQVQLHFANAYQGNLHLYAVDWDSTARRETITVGGQTASLTGGSFAQGAWASVPINVAAGTTLPISVKRTAGSTAVLSGIMLGDANPPYTITTAPEGTWVGAFGSSGYDLAGWTGSGDLGYSQDAAATLTKGSRYVWAPQTTETRALENPSGSARVAATYYDPSQLEAQLHFTKEFKGDLHLYAVDWDSAGRREVISVNGQSATLSSDFSKGAWVTFPIEAAAGQTVPITVARTAGPNAVLSGILLGNEGSPPAPTVESAPQGKWVGAVGSSGYALGGWDGTAGDVSYLPDASLTLQQGSRWLWAANTTDVRALSDPAEHIRNAATYYDPNQIQMQLSFNEAYTGELHLYALDWDSESRREIISVNGQSAVLSSDFSQGAWVSFPVNVPANGTVSITVSRVSGGSAVLSGIFLGNTGTPPVPKLESAPQGKWVGAVGSSGYALTGWNGTAGGLAFLPSASLTVQQGSGYQWAANTTDPRALSDPTEPTRNAAATVYDPNQIQTQLSFTAAYSGELHLYAVDWDSAGRREVITVNGQSAVLGSDFSAGAWVAFPVSVQAGGTISITVTRLAGPNAVLSGIFLGNAGTPPGATVSSSPQGSWVGSYGTAGYALAAWNEPADLVELPKATLTVEQASRYTWAASTSDVRALQSPDKSTRIAATYYDPHEIKLKLSFKEAYSGTLRLYALDWDSTGRREVITVNGQSAALSSDFSAGAWVSFPISVAASGTVSITVTCLAGGNAVLSGLFLG